MQEIMAQQLSFPWRLAREFRLIRVYVHLIVLLWGYFVAEGARPVLVFDIYKVLGQSHLLTCLFLFGVLNYVTIFIVKSIGDTVMPIKAKMWVIVFNCNDWWPYSLLVLVWHVVDWRPLVFFISFQVWLKSLLNWRLLINEVFVLWSLHKAFVVGSVTQAWQITLKKLLRSSLSVQKPILCLISKSCIGLFNKLFNRPL